MRAAILLCMFVLLPGLAVSAAPLAVVQDVGELEAKLRSRDAYERGEAIEALIRKGSPAAWELVIDCLEDPAGRVADKAQMALADVPKDLREELLGKRGLQSKKALVPLRVAELIGRMEIAYEPKVYSKALKTKDAAVRRSVLWSVERLALRDLLDADASELVEDITKLARKERDDNVRAQALVTLGALSPDVALELLPAAASAKAPQSRAAATELISLLPTGRQVAALQRASGDDSFLVRWRAYEVASELGSLDGMGVLIAALETESRARLQWRVVEFLRQGSGMKHGVDPRPWKLWLSKQEAGWAPAKKKSRSALGDEGTVSLVGMPILSTHLAFLVDFSGSMWKKKAGKTRKQRVDVEMRKALQGLAEDVEFNIHPFTTDVLSWEKKLTGASKRNVQAAMKYFEGCKAQGKGDYWTAMMAAMEDPAVDTLMILGDGAPSGGTRWDLELMKELFTHENRFRGVAIDALLVETKGRLVSYWESMAERSGGRILTVEI